MQSVKKRKGGGKLMTLQEIEKMDKDVLLPKEVASVLGCVP